MKQMIYQVYVGKKSQLYDFCVDSVARYCKKYNIDHIVQKTPILRIAPDPFSSNRSKEATSKHGGFLPIYEKENAFDYFDRYDQIAIVDADIYIRENAPNLFDELGDHDFAAVCEREMPLTNQYIAKIENYSRMQYSTLKDVDWKWNKFGAEFFNMGLMVLNTSFKTYLKNQTSKQFLDRWEFKRFIDGLGAWKWSTDQTLLNWWIKKEKMNVKHLPWQYNALYKGVFDEKIPDSYFVHFFLRDKLPERGETISQIEGPWL